MTYQQAKAKLPAHAEWSCCFGLPGCPGYVEYWRTSTGGRWNICNGSHESEIDQWHVNRIAASKATNFAELRDALDK